MTEDDRIIFYNNAKTTIEPKIARLLVDFYKLKEWPQTKTCMAMDKHGSNKNHRQHVIYTPFYDALFENLNPSGILEFGIGSQNAAIPFSMNGQLCNVGGSIRAWKDIFPTANVIGADIDPDTLFNENGISCYFVDANNTKTIDSMWENIFSDMPSQKINIIIDDAYHSLDANINLLNHSINHLSTNGFYVIEDINRNNNIHASGIKDWLQSHEYDAVYLDIPNDTNTTCCCMAIIYKS